MANKSLFSSLKGLLPRAESVNQAGAPAYALGPRHALAQIAATGCFNGTFYATGQDQLADLLTLAEHPEVDPLFLAKLAVYSRERGAMKDMPAALLLLVARRDPVLLHRVFGRVVDNGRVLRTLVQMIRSGRFGRKGLSSSLQRAVQNWLNDASVTKLLAASIGKDPSLRDVLRLARPTPKTNARRALFGWLADKPEERWLPASRADLPDEVRALTLYREAASESDQVAALWGHQIRWDLLADAAKGPSVWKLIARGMGPQALRMNLNTLLRHGVFDDPESVDHLARRLADPEEILRSRQMPYQFLSAHLNASKDVPKSIREALVRAAEIACGSVPEFPGPVVIGLDVSGSMQSPVTGHRGRGSTTTMRCVDVAALFAAAVLRRNPLSLIVPFDDSAHRHEHDPSSSILDLAARLAKFGGGGTDCSLPMKEALANHRDRRFAGCVIVSDNQSWIGEGRNGSTPVMTQWQEFVKNQVRLHGKDFDGPKLVCIDLQPYGTTQSPERSDILNVGGFSDSVFSVVSSFLGADPRRFLQEVEALEI